MKFKIGETVRIKPVKGLEGYQHCVGKVGTIIERKERLIDTYKYTIDKTYKIKIEGDGEWGFLEVELERIS